MSKGGCRRGGDEGRRGLGKEEGGKGGKGREGGEGGVGVANI